MNRFKTLGDSLNKSPCNGIYQLINLSRSLKAKKITHLLLVTSLWQLFSSFICCNKGCIPVFKKKKKKNEPPIVVTFVETIVTLHSSQYSMLLKKYLSAKNATPTIGEGLEKSAGHSVSLCDVNPDKPVLNFKLV